jgi:hypothetical protein
VVLQKVIEKTSQDWPLLKLALNGAMAAPTPTGPVYANLVGNVTTQSVPEAVFVSSIHSFITYWRIIAAETASRELPQVEVTTLPAAVKRSR